MPPILEPPSTAFIYWSRHFEAAPAPVLLANDPVSQLLNLNVATQDELLFRLV